MPRELSKVTAKTAAEICTRAQIEEEAVALLRDGHSPADFLEVLVEKERLPDAIRFLAQALPPREAVRWAWKCAREFAPAGQKPETVAALDAAEKWLADPSDANRRAAMEAAEKARETAPGLVGAAAFFSEGSIAPPDRDPVPPPAGVAGAIAGGAVLLAAVKAEPAKAAENYRLSLNLGRELAQ